MFEYQIETPYGIFKRKSKKEYSHIVLIKGECYGTEERWIPVQWVEYCGRYELAAKKAQQYEAGNLGYGRKFKGIVEIYDATKKEGLQ